MAIQKGIDISVYNIITDWDAAAKDVEFVIIRAGFGKTPHSDTRFDDHYAAAKSKGLSIGVYWFSYAKDEREAAIEAAACIETLKGKSIDMPVFYDIEDDPVSGYVVPKPATNIAKTFIQKLKEAGYESGLYSNSSSLNSDDYYDKNYLKEIFVWVADWHNSPPLYKGDYCIWQHEVATAGAFSWTQGPIDLNYNYKSYNQKKEDAAQPIISTPTTNITKYLLSQGEQINDTIVNNWIDEYISYDEEFIQYTNKDLDKIVIGQGGIDLSGNYTIQGCLDEDGQTRNEDQEYISFKDLFSPLTDRLVYIPSLEEDNITNALCGDNEGQHYHNKIEKKWSWDKKKDKIYVPDRAYLLFKANQTINNPYIGIQVDSGPLQIIFQTTVLNQYDYPTKQGIEIDVKEERDNKHYYKEKVRVKIIPVNKNTCSTDFLELISFDASTGDFNHGITFVWKNEYLISSYNAWTGITDVESPAVCSVFLKTTDENISRPYLLFLDDEYQGIIYLTKENRGESDGESNTTAV